MERIELPALDVIANVQQVLLQKKHHVLLCMICGSRTNVEDQRRLQGKTGMESLRYCEECSWDLPVSTKINLGRDIDNGND
tara:strand:- start:61 stop:303 length:243 start_codon:yes stop_codon:yes gene_type:complete